MANPVVSNFFPPEGVTYYKPDGSEVRPDEELHIHADGTVMTEHSDIGSNTMADTSVVVTTNMPMNTENSQLLNGMDVLEQDALVNGAKHARTEQRIRRTLNRLGSTRVQKYPGVKQRLQKKLSQLQNQAQQSKNRRVQINQARREQISPNILRRQINRGQVSTPINNELVNNIPSLPDGKSRPTTYGQQEVQLESALDRREDLQKNRLSTGGNAQGRNLPAGSRDTSLRRQSSRGEQQPTPRPTPTPPRRTGGSGGSSGGGGY